MAKKRIGIVSNDNGWGLTKDIQIIKDVLSNNYFQVQYKHFEPNGKRENFDLQIHSEIIGGKLINNSKYNVLLPNPEWTNPEWLHARGRRERFIATLCKTKHAVPIFKQLGMRNVFYIGFTTKDKKDHSILDNEKIPEFLHIAGHSMFKNTEKVIKIWNSYSDLPKLHIFHSRKNLENSIKTSNIEYRFGRKSDTEITDFQNKYLYHIQPSMSEGFGHVLWESLSCGSILITLDAPPMNEVYGLKIKNAKLFRKHGFGELYTFDVDDGYDCILDALKLTAKQNRVRQLQSRQTYLANDIQFRKRFYNTIKDIIHGKYQ